MGLSDFHQKTRSAWVEALKAACGDVPPSLAEWTTLDSIRHVLAHVMGINANHAHLPTGGGQDFEHVKQSVEAECLEFMVGRTAYLLKPKRLVLRWVEIAPAESFLLLEADTLKPVLHSGIVGSEEVLDLGNGEYVERAAFEEGRLGYDEHGHEIKLPARARLVVRWLGGSFLLVCKGSAWNASPDTYRGIHNRMSVDQMYQLIVRSI